MKNDFFMQLLERQQRQDSEARRVRHHLHVEQQLRQQRFWLEHEHRREEIAQDKRRQLEELLRTLRKPWEE